MSVVHLISSQAGSSLLEESLQISSLETAQILLIGDGVVTALLPDSLSKFRGLQIFALEDDCLCRGIQHLVDQSIKLIKDEEMVKLCAESKQVVSW